VTGSRPKPDYARRRADPPFPAAVRLLGRTIPLAVERRTPHRERRLILSAVTGAVAKLEAEHRAGLLSRADIECLASLKWFVFGRGRSGQHRGAFIFGVADVKLTRDPDYWSAALVHDGMHARLQAKARAYRDETRPCNVQIDYMRRTGAQPYAIEAVERFRDSRSRQRKRTGEDY